MFIGDVLLVVAVAVIISMYAVMVIASSKLIQKVGTRALASIDRINEES